MLILALMALQKKFNPLICFTHLTPVLLLCIFSILLGYGRYGHLSHFNDGHWCSPVHQISVAWAEECPAKSPRNTVARKHQYPPTGNDVKHDKVESSL